MSAALPVENPEQAQEPPRRTLTNFGVLAITVCGALTSWDSGFPYHIDTIIYCGITVFAWVGFVDGGSYQDALRRVREFFEGERATHWLLFGLILVALPLLGGRKHLILVCLACFALLFWNEHARKSPNALMGVRQHMLGCFAWSAYLMSG